MMGLSCGDKTLAIIQCVRMEYCQLGSVLCEIRITVAIRDPDN